MTLKDTINKVKEIYKETKDLKNPENLDAKVVFQDTKKSLEALKESLFMQEDGDKKKQQEQYLVKYMDRLLEFSTLTASDKDFLIQLKQNISKESVLKKEDIEEIIAIVSHLEQKAEDLSELDKEKIKELHKALTLQKTSLDLLKKGVESVAPTLEEAKKKAFETMKKDLEEHRWSSWLAQPVYDYLVDKHINKKPVSKFKERLIGTVGLTVVGWFVGKDLKNLIANIDNLSIEEILGKAGAAAETVKETISTLSKEKLDEYHTKMESGLYGFFKEKFGKNFDREKFKKVFEEWSKERDPKTYFKDQKERIENATHGEGTYDTLGEAFGLVSMPAKGIFDLLIRMKNEGLISWNDILIDGVVMPSGKAILKVGIGAAGLFANTMKTVFTSMTVEELTEYIKEQNSKLDLDSRMALWGMMYRRGGWIWNLASHLGYLAGEGMSYLFMQRTGGDIGKVSAYRRGGVGNNFEKELQVFKQLEDGLKNTGIFKEIKTKSGATILEDIMSTMKRNLAVFDIMSNAKSFSEIETALKNQGFHDVLSELKNSVHWGKNLSKVKTVAGNVIEVNMNKAIFIAEDSFGTWKKMFGKHMNFSWSKFPYEVELIDKMKNFSKLQGKMLQDDAILNDVKNFFRRFNKGKQLSGMVEYADNVKFSLSNVDDAKAFFDNVRTIGKHSPEILKTLFKGFPLIMMGKDLLSKLANPTENDQSFVRMVTEGFLYLVPLVGPFMLVSDGLTLKDGKFQSLGGAGIGAGLFALDGFYAAKAVSKREFLKFMTSPIRDAGSFLKSMGKGAYGVFKMTRDGIRVFRAGEAASFGAESLTFLKGAGLRLAGVALLCYLGYVGYRELGASNEEKKQFAEIEKMDKKSLEDKIQQDWSTMNEEQKSDLIKFATLHRMGLSNLDAIDAKKDGEDIAIKFKTLVNYNQMKDVEQDLQMALSTLETTKNVRLHFALDGGAVKYELLALKKKEFMNEQGVFNQQGMKDYLLAMGYNQELVGQFTEKVA